MGVKRLHPGAGLVAVAAFVACSSEGHPAGTAGIGYGPGIVGGSTPVPDAGTAPVVDAATPPADATFDAEARGPPGVLAQGLTTPAGIAVDATRLYWIDLGALDGSGAYAGGRVMACPLPRCSGGSTVLASGVTAPYYDEALVVGATDLYFLADAHVATCPLAGCPGGSATSVLAGQPGVVTALALDPANLYWTIDDITTSTTTQVNACPLADCTPNWTPLATPDDANSVELTSVAVDSTDVYWTGAAGSISRCAIGGCQGAPSVVWTGAGGTYRVAVDANNVYWTQSLPAKMGAVMQCPKSGCAAGAKAIASARTSPSSLAVDETSVYWVEGFAIDKCPIGGGAVTVVATYAAYGVAPRAIALDGTNVYASLSGGFVVATPK